MHGRNLFDLIHTSWRWPIIIVCVVILFTNASGTIKIDALLDSTPEENINKFISSVENINPDYTMGEAKSGIKIYDENRITYNMMYGMGHEEYYVYVFTKTLPLDSEINLALENYVSQEGSLPVYSIERDLLLDTIDSIYTDFAPVVLKMKRDNSGDGKPVTSVENYYNTVDLINSEMIANIKTNNVDSKNNNESVNSNEKTDVKDSTEEEKKGIFGNLFGKEDNKEGNKKEKDNGTEEEKKGFFDKLFDKDGELR